MKSYESKEITVADSATTAQMATYEIPAGKRVTGIAVAPLSGTPVSSTTVSAVTESGSGIPRQPLRLLETSTSVPMLERYTPVDMTREAGKIGLTVTPNGTQTGATVLSFVFRLESL